MKCFAREKLEYTLNLFCLPFLLIVVVIALIWKRKNLSREYNCEEND